MSRAMRKTWHEIPVHESIMRILMIKKGSLTDRELYEALTSIYDLSYPEFLKILMKMELNGAVKVSTAKDGLLIIELL